MRLPVVRVSAFSDTPFGGNPAAVIRLDAPLSGDAMQQLARENTMPATAFVSPHDAGAGEFDIRWFSPAGEIALCGHATLASGHVLLAADRDRDAVVFHSRSGAELRVARTHGGYAMRLPTLDTAPASRPDLAKIIGGAPVETRWNARGYALFVFADAAAVRALRPEAGDTSGAQMIATAPGVGDPSGADIVSRVFVQDAAQEDMVTGSAHSALTPYWAARLGRDSLSAFQASPRGGYLDCRLIGTEVELTGRCVTTLVGDVIL